MNMDLLQTRFMAPLGTVGGAAVGGMIAGPAGIVTGAKLGACVGAQIGLAGKVDKAADSALEIGVRALEKVVDAWSGICLTGYIGYVALNCSLQSMTTYRAFCSSWYQDLNCATLSLTNISFNTCALATAAALAYHAFQLLPSKKI